MNERTGEGRAVSPVIGVVLMIAVTVIFAAVVAAFVVGIGPTDPGPNAMVDLEQNGNDTVVTLQYADRLDSWQAACDDPPTELNQSAVAGSSVTVENCDPEDVVVRGEYEGQDGLLT